MSRSCCIRIGHDIARNRSAAKTHVIQQLGLHTMVDFDAVQRLRVGELCKRHGEKLIRTREVSDLVVAILGGHTAAKLAQQEVGHELRKHELVLVHGGPSRRNAIDHKSDTRCSNRDQIKTPHSQGASLTCSGLTRKCWDRAEVVLLFNVMPSEFQEYFRTEIYWTL